MLLKIVKLLIPNPVFLMAVELTLTDAVINYSAKNVCLHEV
jgi:hypothetical protein